MLNKDFFDQWRSNQLKIPLGIETSKGLTLLPQIHVPTNLKSH